MKMGRGRERKWVRLGFRGGSGVEGPAGCFRSLSALGRGNLGKKNSRKPKKMKKNYKIFFLSWEISKLEE